MQLRRRPSQPTQTNRAPRTSYYRGGALEGKTSPFEKKRESVHRHQRLAAFIDIVIILVVLFCLGYSLMVQPTPRIMINSLAYHPTSVYQAAARQDLSGLRNRNKISFNEQGVIESLQKQFPEISTASVELPIFGQKPTLRLTIAPPAFVLNSNGSSYVINTDGVAAIGASKLSGSQKLLVVVDQSGFKTTVGSRVLSADNVSFITQIIAQCKHTNVPISSMSLPALAGELDLHTVDKPYYVKFYLDGNAMLETGQFLAARHQFAASHQDPAQYLDVRVSGKIFYK